MARFDPALEKMIQNEGGYKLHDVAGTLSSASVVLEKSMLGPHQGQTNQAPSRRGIGL
ncbi:MAG: hypothetical protein ACE5GK_06185 [Nitrospiria bacterium]